MKVKLPSFNNPISCLLTSSIQLRLIINQSAYLSCFLEFIPTSKGIKFTYPSCFQISALPCGQQSPWYFHLFIFTAKFLGISAYITPLLFFNSISFIFLSLFVICFHFYYNRFVLQLSPIIRFKHLVISNLGPPKQTSPTSQSSIHNLSY